MILVDTSCWVEHLRRGLSGMRELPGDGVVTHEFVIGELASGGLGPDSSSLRLVETFPRAVVVDHADVMLMVRSHRLWGRGLGWIDLHLLASALVTPAKLFTLDRSLRAAADSLGVTHR
jgi:hypothetical protein